MIKKLELKLPPEVAYDDTALRYHLSQEGYIPADQTVNLLKERRSIDARGRQVCVNLSLSVYIDEPIPAAITYNKTFKDVSDAEAVIIVGAGPAGLFAALRCVELGYKPILIERGKDVQSRRRDLAAINKDHIVNPESNYCFGEGGAGTYSDGKLYT
ncbi:MAG TPA: NAD(P)/FAD-dependent oxidoreductase, partial [Cytophagales bacterium]|nr:NAD(P)/FAD-dependent oxidoreductase [Cytophagales bacterium]